MSVIDFETIQPMCPKRFHLKGMKCEVGFRKIKVKQKKTRTYKSFQPHQGVANFSNPTGSSRD